MSRAAIQEINSSSIDENEITVEQFLEMQCKAIIDDFQGNTAELIARLRAQYEEGAKAILQLMKTTIPGEPKSLCVILKCIAGAHIGQRFRLEHTETSDEVFKIGRSTGKQFKEKGVSLYKDKEISTTHAKIEVRNGQAFLIDMRSTNGTQLNNDDIEALVPYRLQNGDVITMGSTQLRVQVTDGDANDENAAPDNQ